VTAAGPRTTISVVIPTINRPADLVETAQAVAAQTRLPDELIVVDQSPTANTSNRLRQLFACQPAVRLIYIWNPAIIGLPMARNAGFDASTGDLICYLDDDITPARDYLAQIERGFARFPAWDGLCGRFTDNESQGFSRRLCRGLFRRGLFRDDRARLATMNRPAAMRLICGGASCFRRDVLQQLRFDETLTGYALGEDVEFCLRARRRFSFGAYPLARWHHRRSPAGRPDPKEMRRMARASAAYMRRVHRRHAGDDLSYLWLMAGFGIEHLFSNCTSAMRFPIIRRAGLESVD
jgi:glycosyltransferase involved in cell wall biosynthesis